jgi:hypothetical protein
MNNENNAVQIQQQLQTQAAQVNSMNQAQTVQAQLRKMEQIRIEIASIKPGIEEIKQLIKGNVKPTSASKGGK